MSTTVTNHEIRTMITRGLTDRAALCRREAKLRYMSGNRNKDARAAMRAEAQMCEDLARAAGQASPFALAAVLGAHQVLTVIVPLTAGTRHPDDLAYALRQAASGVQAGHGDGEIRGQLGDFAGTWAITG